MRYLDSARYIDAVAKAGSITLISIQNSTMKEQEKILDTTIVEWQGDLDQIDDILVIGVRIS